MDIVKSVGVLGPEGTNGHFAFGRFQHRFYDELKASQPVFVQSHSDILRGLEDGRFDCGVVPIENCTTGLIGDVANFWAGSGRSSRIVAEQWIGISHCMVGHRGTAAVDRIISDPRAYEQCRSKLTQSKLLVREHAVELANSTGEAARLISMSLVGNGKAAIASRFAAGIYKLEVLEKDMNDSHANATRFHLLCRLDLALKFKRDKLPAKLAIAFGLEHRPRAQSDVLCLLALSGANITCYNSIALGVNERYAFYMELTDCKFEWSDLKPILAGITRDLKLGGEFGQFNEVVYP